MNIKVSLRARLSSLSRSISLSLSLLTGPSSMWQLPQRNFLPFAVTVQSGAGAGAGAGAEAGDGGEAEAGAVAEGRRILLPRPGALCCMTAGAQRQDIYVCVECLCLSLQPGGHGCHSHSNCCCHFTFLFSFFLGSLLGLRRLVSRNKRGAKAP